MPRPTRSAVVVGGAVLDSKVRTLGPPVLGTSNPGTARASVGGVGRNVAENLARLGTRTELVAAVGDDLAGATVTSRTGAAGVDCRHLVVSPEPTGTYTAVLDETGDLLVAVSDMRATDALTADDLAGAPDLLRAAALCVLDANLAPAVLDWLLGVAAGAAVPVVLEPVSVAKARACAGVLDGRHPVHTVTPNVDELGALTGSAVDDGLPAVRAAAASLHERGVEHVWVRRGTRGSLLSVASPGLRAARVFAVSAPAVEVADVTGAGDSMTAGYVHALLRGDDPVEAARFGQVLAALTCASTETVRPDLTAALVAAHLQPSAPSVEELP